MENQFYVSVERDFAILISLPILIPTYMMFFNVQAKKHFSSLGKGDWKERGGILNTNLFHFSDSPHFDNQF
jgi:hypothetical protein